MRSSHVPTMNSHPDLHGSPSGSNVSPPPPPPPCPEPNPPFDLSTAPAPVPASDPHDDLNAPAPHDDQLSGVTCSMCNINPVVHNCADCNTGICDQCLVQSLLNGSWLAAHRHGTHYDAYHNCSDDEENYFEGCCGGHAGNCRFSDHDGVCCTFAPDLYASSYMSLGRRTVYCCSTGCHRNQHQLSVTLSSCDNGSQPGSHGYASQDVYPHVNPVQVMNHGDNLSTVTFDRPVTIMTIGAICLNQQDM